MIGAILQVEIMYTNTKKSKKIHHDKNNKLFVSLRI